MDTIFAEATAPGKAGVAIVRLSGPQAVEIAEKLCGKRPDWRRASLREIRSSSGDLLDHGIVLAFPAGASFTGEDVVELHLHGSRAVVASVLAALATFDGTRLAEPGEFTRRALDNDRLDLTQVEGLADLINAETELQRQQAQRVMDGRLSEEVLNWRRDLIEAAALIEATLDFADEDVPVDVLPDVRARLDRVLDDLEQEIAGFNLSERIRNGFEVAILGAPNAGKSTLLNAIARRDVALTSEIAGTTRDVIEVRTDLGGLPVTFLDTAGLRETIDPLEKAGISRALQRAEEADLRVLLLNDHDSLELPVREDDIILRGKADLGSGDVSGLTGEGVDALIERIATVLRDGAQRPALAIRKRHVDAMVRGRAELLAAQTAIVGQGDGEIVAMYVRGAIGALEVLVGRIDIEDLLGDIFSRFCIGK